ncbi:nucleoside-triphosphatase [Desulfoplanes formicivorans]|uniref:Nucleoside triphosphatase n=1 Tax=Desulfoplanes formicivorans TaxID=1592317 RepID=A0A194AE47_9BACT|nr:nucleoside-triphosphatase [Desulfoplanes formicivorans]GAU07401.1 nucleoside triphosphatase [Desulfoplanes formicivorans]
MKPTTIILTGAPQSGKSTLLARALDRLSDLKTTGFLAKGLWKNNLREGFDLVDLTTGKTTPLARRNPLAPPKTIPFTFFREGMEAGNKALDPAKCKHADLVCVDEVGKLEMQGRGWARLLGPLLQLEHPVHLWVVRQELVHPVSCIWSLQNPVIVDVHDPTALELLVTHIRTQP